MGSKHEPSNIQLVTILWFNLVAKRRRFPNSYPTGKDPIGKGLKKRDFQKKILKGASTNLISGKKSI